MEQTNLESYRKELNHALARLKDLHSEAQVVMGIVESFLYLIGKESKKEAEKKEVGEAKHVDPIG